MRFAVASDFHLGYNEDALPQAQEALEKALSMDVDFILMPGDLVDRRLPKHEVILEAVRLFRKVKENGAHLPGTKSLKFYELKEGKEHPMQFDSLPLLAIPGTHERRSKGLVNVIQILDSAHLLVNIHARTLVVEKGGERVAVQGLAGVPEDYLKRTIEAAEFRPVTGMFNVFAFHQSMIEFLPFEGNNFISMEDLPFGFARVHARDIVRLPLHFAVDLRRGKCDRIVTVLPGM